MSAHDMHHNAHVSLQSATYDVTGPADCSSPLITWAEDRKSGWLQDMSVCQEV